MQRYDMLQVFAQIGSLPSVIFGLIALAVVVFVGRIVLNVAWKLVMAALLVVTVLWVLGAIGLPVGSIV